MGTRGAVGFRYKNKDKITYNHFDSYVDGLGYDVVEFIEGYKNRLPDLKEAVAKIKTVKEGDKPTAKQKIALAQYTDLGVSEQSTDDWYCLLRHAQGNLQAYLEAGFMIDSKNFLQDSLFCEYGYVINLDKEVLEFYIGFMTVPDDNPNNRYKVKSPDGQYWHCKLVAEIPLQEVTKERLQETYDTVGRA